MKKTILIDLDGVLNIYSGHFDENFIPPIKDGAYEFVKELSTNFDVKIFTARNKLLASKWIVENNLEEFVSDVTDIKLPVYLIIDDRCLNFQGDYDKILNQVKNFNVWYKQQ